MRNQITKLLSLTALLLLSVLPFSGCLSDGGTEIPNEVNGTLYTASGAPAANAQVALIQVSYTPGASATDTGKFLTQTDAIGKYAFKKVPDGYYNVVASGSGLVAFRDSVLASGGATLPNDTLRAAGTITATVQLQPQHSPQTATVQVLGTEYYVNVPASGVFTLTLPQGTHRLRVVVSLPEYTPLFRAVTVTSGVNDTLPEPLAPFYSGIPAATGLTATADSLGKVTVRWNNTGYAALQRYLVYRVTAGSLSQGSIIANTTDTTWTDTVFAQMFGQVPGTGRFYFSDTVPRAYDYRVRVQSMTDEIGLAFGLASVTVRSGGYYHGAPSATALTAAADSTGKVRLRWSRSHAGYSGGFQIFRATAGSSSLGTLIASTDDTAFTDTVFAQAYGQAPKSSQFAFTDTLPRAFEYRVWATASASDETGPLSSVSATALPPALSPAFTSGRWHLATASAPFSARTGHTVLVFNNALWMFGPHGSNGVWTSSNGIAWQAVSGTPPFTSRQDLQVALLRDTLWVTSSSLTSGNDLWKSADGISWITVGTPVPLPAEPTAGTVYNHRFLGFKDEVWYFGGNRLNGSVYNYQNRMLSSTSGISWTTTTYTFSGDTNFTRGMTYRAPIAALSDKLWLVGGGSSLGAGFPSVLNFSVFGSDNGTIWTEALPRPAFLPRAFHSVTSHDGKLWVIGGNTALVSGEYGNGYATSEIWSSPDGANWSLVDIKAPFTARGGVATVSFQGKLWVIGGWWQSSPGLYQEFNDIWYYE